MKRKASTSVVKKGSIGLFIVVGICMLSASCVHNTQKEKPVPALMESLPEFRLRQAIEFLEKGERKSSQEILEGLLQEDEPRDIRPKAYFYLGIIKLYEIDDLTQMEECKKYFDAYPQKFPEGPFQQNAQHYSQLLEKYIHLSRKQQQRLKILSRQVKEQAQEIETLQYKILKLEEIQQETEKKRQSLELTN